MQFLKSIKFEKFQLSSILFVIIYILAVLVWEHKKDNYAEPIYPIFKVDEEIKQIASNVSVGLHVNNFPKFSFDLNDFTMDAFVWFKFPVGTESLDTIKRFDFQNGEIKYKSSPMIKLIKDDVIVTYRVKVEFKAYLNYKDFPLGDHRLNIILDNKSVTPNELCFNTKLDNFILSKNILVSTWKPVRKMIQSGYLKSNLQETNSAMEISYPCAVFTIDFENSTLRNLMTLYFPMYVIFFICLFSLIIGISQYLTRMSLIAAAMPILVLFRTVILQLAPPMSEITKADFVYFLLVFLSLVILLFQAHVVMVMKKIKEYDEKLQEQKKNTLTKVNNVIFLLIIVILVVAITYNSLFM